MPIFEYECTDCKQTYDVFHKVREIDEDVMCPSCGSSEQKKLMSATSFSMSGSDSNYSSLPSPGCATEDCSDGYCGLN